MYVTIINQKLKQRPAVVLVQKIWGGGHDPEAKVCALVGTRDFAYGNGVRALLKGTAC